jgi:hypothetical protein
MGTVLAMLSHIVLLKPRSDLTQTEREEFVQAFRHALQTIPDVRSVRIGTRIRHGAGYEGAMPDTADFVAAIDFDDVNGLKRYLAHPSHAELGRLFGVVLSSALVYDFEVGGLDVLQNVLGRSI